MLQMRISICSCVVRKPPIQVQTHTISTLFQSFPTPPSSAPSLFLFYSTLLSQLTPRRTARPRRLQLPGLPHRRRPRALLVPLLRARRAVEALLARRDVQRRVAVEEVDGLERDLEDLDGHDGEVLDARHVVDAELHEDDDVGVDGRVAAVRPAAHAGAAARLVGVEAAGVELAVAVRGQVDVVVGELGARVVEGLRVGQDLLEGRRHDLVGDGLVVDRVAHAGVDDLVDAVGVRVEVVAAGVGEGGFGDGVAGAVRVEGRARHRVRFVVDEAVGVALERRVDAQREDVLVVHGEDARVDDRAEGDLDAFVDGLGGQDAGGADLVHELAGLVELEGEDVFVVGDGDDALEDELAVAHDGGAAGAVVGVLPADAGVLLVDADHVGHVDGAALVVGQDRRQVVDVAQAVAA